MLSTSLLLAAIACTCLGFFFTCCCTTCTICTDNFDRSDDTNINTGSSCGWTEVSGSWDIFSGTLRCTSAGIAACSATHPDGEFTMSASARVSHNTSGSACDILIGYLGSTQYFYVRVTFNNSGGTLEIREKNGGSDTQLAVVSGMTFDVDGYYLVTACVTESETISVSIDGVPFLTATASGIAGDGCGLGANGSGSAIFDSFTFSRAYHTTSAEDCGKCSIPCDQCTDSVAADQYQIVISGSIAISGTYIVSAQRRPEFSNDPCYWFLDTSVCSPTLTNGIYLRFLSTGPEVFFAGVNCNYKLSLTAPYDCLASRVLTNVLASCSCAGGSITLTGTTATITAIP